MIGECLRKVSKKEDLDQDMSYQCMQDIINGRISPVKTAALLTALSMKGETVDEITGFVRAMRKASLKVSYPQKPLVDTCGTGGDTLKTFNVSTAAALMAASCGVTIAKHGNRSITSKCGGADILEAAGVNIYCDPSGVESCLDVTGIGFMFAPIFHPAMKKVASIRRDLGIRTVFNILGPLSSPACADIQLLGVFDPELVEPVARVLLNLNVERALVVHGFDERDQPAMDEISIVGKTKIALVDNNRINVREIYPEDFGLEQAEEEHIMAPETLASNLNIFFSVLKGDKESPQDKARLNLCLINAAAILLISGKAADFQDGLQIALESVQEGNALLKLEEFIRISNSMK
jgi:anthranilate phosphoribosyltransferase